MKTQARFRLHPDHKTALKARHQRLLEKLGSQMLVVAARIPFGKPDSSRFPYRPESHFFYLTGLDEEKAIAVFNPSHPTEKTVLFIPERVVEHEVWQGPMLGVSGAQAELPFDAVYPFEEFATRIDAHLKLCSGLWVDRSPNSPFEKQLSGAMMSSRVMRNGLEIFDPQHLIGDLRLFKDDWEVAQLQRANDVASRAHELCMSRVRPGMLEYQLQAALECEMKSNGALFLGYPSIVCAGDNGTCLHYTKNNCAFEAGELVLIDAGCEVGGYTSDITRTFPVAGSYTGEQRAIYEIVLATQKAIIDSIRPGVPSDQLQKDTVRLLTQGLVDAGIVKATFDELMAKDAYKEFYPHGVSHWLGLDVHDQGRYFTGTTPRPLAPGMVMTVEPGIYIQNGSPLFDSRWHGIGVRIEDDVLCTASGHRNFTTCVKEMADVEALTKAR